MVAYGYQFRHGLAATAMTNYFSWGVYIVNFVFFIGISHAGTLVSAILRVTGAEWRRPDHAHGGRHHRLRAADRRPDGRSIDMGRPDRLLYVVLHGRSSRPILWDVMSVTTYMTGSLLYLYLPMIPDMACSLRGHGPARRFALRRWLYAARHRLDRRPRSSGVAWSGPFRPWPW